MQITRGIIPSAQKVIIYGPEGIGKSTFAAQFPDPVFIDTEGSTKHLDVARTPRPTSWPMLLDQVRHFQAHPEQCKTLVIDTADWAEQLYVNHVCGKAQKSGIEDFGYGKGYVYLAEEFGKLLNLLTELAEHCGIHVVLTAHAKMRKFEQPEELGAYDRWEMKLGKNTAPLAKEWADMVLFARYKIHVVNVDDQGAQKGKNKAQGGQRVMMTSHNPSWDAKNRHGLKEELPFSYSEIAHCITAGSPPPSPQEAPAPAPDVSATPQQTTPADSTPKPADGQKYTGDFPPSQQNPIHAEPPLDPAIPQALRDLMTEHTVTEDEIQEAVAKRGYYPADTPVRNYDPGFIQGVLIGAWPSVLKMIEKEVRDLPF